MVTKSIADAKISRYQTDTPSTSGNLTDLEWNFYSSQSGLTPASKYSITDHKRAYYALQGYSTGTIREVETAFFKSQGAVGASFDDLRYDFYNNRQFFIPSALANLELWLEADNISGAVLASDSFDRSKNLLAGVDPSFESGLTNFAAVGGSSTLVQSAAQKHSGANSALYTCPTAGLGADNVAARYTINGLTVGTQYTFSIYTYGDGTNPWHLYITSGATLAIGSNFSAATWARQYITFTPTASTVIIDVRNAAVTAAGQFVYIDDIQVELGSKPTAFVWGDSTHLGTTDQGQVWTIASGSWGVSGGVCSAGNVNANLASFDLGVVDGEISVTVGALGSVGLSARITDTNNLVQVAVPVDGSITIHEAIAGSFNGRGFASAGTVKTGDTLTLSVIGSSAVVRVNGVQAAIGALTTQLTQTRFGLRASASASTTYKNLVVKTPIYSDGAALPVWPDKSGYARHAVQATAAKRPLLRSDSPNKLTYNQATVEIDTSGLGFIQNCTVARVTTQAASGSASLQVTSSAAGDVQAGTLGGLSGVPIKSNTPYRCLISVKDATAGLGNWWITAAWYDVLGNLISGSDSTPTVVGTTGSFTSATFDATSPANAVYVRITAHWTAVAAGEIRYVDQLGLYDRSVSVPSVWLPPVTLPNSKPAVQFDGADDTVRTVSGFNWDTSTVFTVHSLLPIASGTTSIVVQATNADTHTTYYSGPSTKLASFDGGVRTDTAVTPSGSWHMQGSSFDVASGTVTADMDGTVTSNSGATIFKPATDAAIGADNAQVRAMIGSIAAVVIFSRILSTTERQSVERYLRNKYGTP